MAASTKVRPPITPLCRAGSRYQRTGHPGHGPGHRELWGAVSSDRTWRYSRQDEPGTPWTVERWDRSVSDYREVAAGFGTLRAARIATADRAWVEAMRAQLCGLPASVPEVPAVARWRIVAP